MTMSLLPEHRTEHGKHRPMSTAPHHPMYFIYSRSVVIVRRNFEHIQTFRLWHPWAGIMEDSTLTNDTSRE